jgi:hypothetical protein
MRAAVWIGAVVAVVILGAWPGSAAAVNITGTWTATLSCDALVDGHSRERFPLHDQVLQIVMTSDHEFQAELNTGALFQGVAVDDGRIETRGEVIAQLCTGSPAFNWILQLDAKVNDTTGGGTLTGEVIQFAGGTIPFVFTCRGTFRRMAPSTPTLSGSC